MLEYLYRLLNDALGTIIEWQCRIRAISFYTAPVTLVDAATITPNGGDGTIFELTAASDAIRAFALPTNMEDGQPFQITLKNTSGGALTQTTFAAGYHGTMTLPATGKQRTYQFYFDDSSTLAYQTVQTAADVTI